MMTGSEDFTGYYAFVNSALIILREGLEAALILAAIVAMLKVMDAANAIRYIHFGWILALFAGFLTWLASANGVDFQRSASREHGGVHLGLCGRGPFLRGILAAHPKSKPNAGNRLFKVKCRTCFPVGKFSASSAFHSSRSTGKPLRSSSFIKRFGYRPKAATAGCYRRFRDRRHCSSGSYFCDLQAWIAPTA